MVPLLISYAIMAATLLLCDCARNLLLPSLLGPSSALSKVLTDALLSVELCATAFEMGAIIEHYGVNAWMLGLFCLAFYQVSLTE